MAEVGLKTITNLFNWGLEQFNKHFGKKFFNYLIVGGIGVIANIIITFLLTEFVFGRENYIYAFCIGTLINMTYNFIFYSKITFKVQKIKHAKKIIFYIYSLFIVLTQIFLVDILVDLIGVNYYIFIIIFVIGILSILSFIFFKLVIFKN